MRLADTDKMMRTAATTVLGLMKVRVHTEGKDSNGNQIGTYSEAYMKVRTGNFSNSTKVTKGKNTGKLKDAGVFTNKSAKAGSARPKYNRTADPKVIASLTRQMENDEKVIPLGAAHYGIGFSNKHNFDKSQWVEATYQKKIFSTSEEERDTVIAIAEKFAKDAISGTNS